MALLSQKCPLLLGLFEHDTESSDWLLMGVLETENLTTHKNGFYGKGITFLINQEYYMSDESSKMLHNHGRLLSHPGVNDMISSDDNDWTRNEPERVE